MLSTAATRRPQPKLPSWFEAENGPAILLVLVLLLVPVLGDSWCFLDLLKLS